MKPQVENKLWKLAGMTIVGLIAAGTLLVAVTANLSAGSSLLGSLFVIFIGTIIAVQLVPGVMLFTALIKGIYEALRKEKAE